MWIITANIDGRTYYLQVTKTKVRLNGLKENAVAYPEHHTALAAIKDYQPKINVELNAVPR